MNKEQLANWLEENGTVFTKLSDAIYDEPELSLREHQAAERYCRLLEELGFSVERNVAGIETAFCGVYGSGKPVLGFLGEFDALDGLAQKAGACVREPLAGSLAGHGCGHNLLGAGALAAACAVKEYLQAKGEGNGTVIFYGCPGEEGGAGKAFMAQQGLFEHLDAALTWHPDDVNEVTTGSCLASYQVEYLFEGISAHAAGCPHLGRSALDAVELMNVGVQFLREHIGKYDGVHYAITDAGGLSPNVVQPRAQVLYMLRSDNVTNILKLAKRVDAIAQGAALMTDTKLTRKFIDGSSDVLPNKVLEQAAYANFERAAMPSYTEQELCFAEAISDTCPKEKLPGFATEYDETIEEFVAERTQNGTRAMNDFLMPYYHSRMISPGSTDVGDVSRQTPTVQIHTATWPSGTPGHSWQAVSVGKSSIAHKGMLLAAQVLAMTAADLLEKPELLCAAREEFEKLCKGGYVCPIEDGAKPTIAGEMM